jgi:hypothetical protein
MLSSASWPDPTTCPKPNHLPKHLATLIDFLVALAVVCSHNRHLQALPPLPHRRLHAWCLGPPALRQFHHTVLPHPSTISRLRALFRRFSTSTVSSDPTPTRHCLAIWCGGSTAHTSTSHGPTPFGAAL